MSENNKKTECEFCNKKYVNIVNHLKNCKKRIDLKYNTNGMCVACGTETYINKRDYCYSCFMESLEGEDTLNEDILTLDDELDINVELDIDDDLKDTEENDTDVKSVCSFTITAKKLQNFFNTLKCSGFLANSSSASDLFHDCILRFDGDVMWSATIDSDINVICLLKTNVNNLKNPSPIPIALETTLKYLSSFEPSAIVEFIYESGIIGIRGIGINKSTSKMKTKALYATKIIDVITDDIHKLQFGTEMDRKNLESFEKLGFNLFSKNKNGGVTVFFGVECNTSFIINSKVLKTIMDDGGKFGDRTYPFKFNKRYIDITIKSIVESEIGQITRELRPDNYKNNNIFEIETSSKITNAINNIHGNIECYIGTEGPIVFVNNDADSGLNISYIITII